MKNINVRFWVHCPGNCDGGFVRLTLQPGQSLTVWYGGRHEEGWSSTIHNWCYNATDNTVYYTVSTDGSDCDGRLSSGHTLCCPIEELTNEEPNDFCQKNYDCKGVMLPAWVEEKAWLRDYWAEKANY